MKYVVFLCDGMADHPQTELNGKTPLEVAYTPNMDELARKGLFGLARTVPYGMPPGSDTANLSVFGYDPREFYTGRSPLEAVSIGIELGTNDAAYRCNFVTLSAEPNIEDTRMDDYSAGEISTEESAMLVEALCGYMKTDNTCLYTGTSYRHCFVRRGGSTGAELTPPHDISGRAVRDYLPKGENSEYFLELMRKSREVLKDHEVNISRVQRGLAPANCIWLWGEGKKPALEPYQSRFGLCGSVISAVDLIRGIGLCAGLKVLSVLGITGNYHTDFAAKGRAAIEALANGDDFVYIHIEAPDECGHRHEVKEKIYAVEQIDAKIIAPVMEYLENSGEGYAVLLTPDHPTPLDIMTHTSDPVPFVLYKKGDSFASNMAYTEANALKTGVLAENAWRLMFEMCEAGAGI